MTDFHGQTHGSQSGGSGTTGSKEEEDESMEENGLEEETDLTDLEDSDDSTYEWSEQSSSDESEEWSSEAETSAESFDLSSSPPSERRLTRGYLKAHPSERSPLRELSPTEVVERVHYKRLFWDDTPVKLIEIHGPAFAAPDVIEVYRRTKAAFEAWDDYDLENGSYHQFNTLAARYRAANEEWYKKKIETKFGKEYIQQLKDDHEKELLRQAESNCSAQAGPSDNSVEM